MVSNKIKYFCPLFIWISFWRKLVVHIERIQVEDGFLDGLDVRLVRGLNVLIGARGTGKTSLIELIRFCLNVRGYTEDSRNKSRNHALSVLGDGQVTVTLSNKSESIVVSRDARDSESRSTNLYLKPIIFSQSEIESVGLQSRGRLHILDNFRTKKQRSADAEENAISNIRSITAEVEAIRREIEDLNQKISKLDEINLKLEELAPYEKNFAGLSTSARKKKNKLDAMSESIASISVAENALSRLEHMVTNWNEYLVDTKLKKPSLEPWPENIGEDPLTDVRLRIEQAASNVDNALKELNYVRSATSEILHKYQTRKSELNLQASALRKAIDAMQAGAGKYVRQVQQLNERKAQLESLKVVSMERWRILNSLINKRTEVLEILDSIRDQRYQLRNKYASQLNELLGPMIKTKIKRAGQFVEFTTAIADVLRGSGLHYNELAPAIAERVSPRELLEIVDYSDYESIAEIVGITKDRANRVLSQLKEANLGKLATVTIDDQVNFQLLDGATYKDISQLSTGQRCTVLLPLVLRYKHRVLIVDQPEDHIDNAFIVDTLIKSIVARGPNSQIIFSTHNANIPVLGNADRVIQLSSDGRRGFISTAAPLNDNSIVSAIKSVMEGGEEAFERRALFYGY